MATQIDVVKELGTPLPTFADEAKSMIQKLDSAIAGTSEAVEAYKTVASHRVAGKNFLKRVGFIFDPLIEIAKDGLRKAKEEKARYTDPVDAVVTACDLAEKRYRTREREAAEAEERRINEQRRLEAQRKADEERRERERIAEEERKKAAAEAARLQRAGEINKREAERMKREAEKKAEEEKQRAAAEAEEAKNNVPEVKVEAAIPKVEGTRRSIRYWAELVDGQLILDAYAEAVARGQTGRAVYLRRFIAIDEQAINAEARSLKDPKKLESLIPGIVAHQEG